MARKKVELFDSTLRDGAQGQGISFSTDDKLKIFAALDRFGIDYIEAGNPFSNPKDLEFFKSVRSSYGAKAVAFGSTARKGVAAKDDENVAALIKADTSHVAVFGKAWDMQVTDIIGASLEENLAMITDTVQYLKSRGKAVIFDAEHFFDGYKANPDYSLEVLKAAQKAGASVIALCDTRGGCMPEEITAAVKAAGKICDVGLGIHCHNDCGCAVANTLAAYRAGASHIQGTFIGIGERCGNANLATITANLQLKYNVSAVSEAQLQTLTETARYIAEVANIKLPGTAPYVGGSAFAHKGGMHADGVVKNPASFEHTAPDAVGNERRLPLSEVSGRAAILSAIKRFDPSLDKNSPETKAIAAKLKKLEQGGFQFEAASASFDMMVLRELGKFTPHFEIDHFKVISSQGHDGAEKANAVIKIKVGDSYEITADEGDGPVNAIDKALRKALEVFYPELSRMHLIDYKVRVIGGADTAAITRVLIESSDGNDVWTTVGASEDIISASVSALTDSLEYMLLKSNNHI
ncbi:MAG: citramalate synthase [Eubacterium sp.]|nr:citramalate synthase [Eubacterium sp.]